MAQELIGLGIVEITAEFIDGTSDPNRRGQKRLDFVLRHADGAYWRLHPGGKKKKDATPKNFPPLRHEVVDGAPEHAAHEWSKPRVFTLTDAGRVPQQDRIGKKRAWEMLQNLPKMHPLHITSGTDFKWWLWVANLAQHSEFELGAGITGAVVTECDRYAVTVVFTRVDSSQCTVTLQWHYNQGYVYYLS